PTAAMRRAMAEAEVGDDVFGEDPTVRTLEEETAELLGTEAAMYVPSGHMGNQLGLYIATLSGQEGWAHEQHHLIGSEHAAAADPSRVQPRLYAGDPGPSHPVLRGRYATAHGDVPPAGPGLVWSENTFSGLVVPLSEQRRVTAFARAHGMRSHLDGARVWNAAAALEVPHAQVAEGFDSVSVCFSKGLGAPVGSALAGDAETI